MTEETTASVIRSAKRDSRRVASRYRPLAPAAVGAPDLRTAAQPAVTRKHPSKVSLYHVSTADRFTPDGFTQPAYLQAELAPEVSRQVTVDGNQRDLESYIRTDINRLYPDLDKDLISIAPQWWDEMLPEWYPGYAKRIATFLKGQEIGRQRIYYCGDYLSQSHTGGACASGRTVARLISRDLARATT